MAVICERYSKNIIWVRDKTILCGYEIVYLGTKYRIAGKFGGEFNLAVWRSPTPNLISPIIRTQELRNEILLRNRKSPNLNSANI